jgi:putative FmdB family regulatory protein
MPIYEYRCQKCGKRSSFFVRDVKAPFSKKCTHCGNSGLERIMSRFASVRSEESRMESLADPSKWGGLDENDPKSVARFAKKMGKEMGEDLGEDFDQLAEEAAREAESGYSDSSEGKADNSTDSSSSID